MQQSNPSIKGLMIKEGTENGNDSAEYSKGNEILEVLSAGE